MLNCMLSKKKGFSESAETLTAWVVPPGPYGYREVSRKEENLSSEER